MLLLTAPIKAGQLVEERLTVLRMTLIRLCKLNL
jgi:hypothetical protein